nr:hypothetical protein [Burkholderia glumae]
MNRNLELRSEILLPSDVNELKEDVLIVLPQFFSGVCNLIPFQRSDHRTLEIDSRLRLAAGREQGTSS